MRISIISEGSYPHKIGGVSVWTYNLVNNLKDIDFECISITYKDRTIRYESENLKNVHVIDVSKFPKNKFGESDVTYEIAKKMIKGESLDVNDLKKLQYFSIHTDGYINALVDAHNGDADFGKYFWALTNVFATITHMSNILRREMNIDLILSLNVGFCGLLGSALKYKFDIPLLCTEHGIILREIEIYLKRTKLDPLTSQMIKNIYASMMKTSYEHCDMVTPISYFHAEHSTRNGCNPNKIRVIYTGIDLERFTPKDSRSKNEMLIGNVGRIEPIKGTKRFVILADYIKKNLENARFWWIGPVDDEEYADEIFKLNKRLGNPVEFKGVTNKPEDFYNQMHIMLMTSLSEGLPLAALEAQACGVPVLSSNVGDSEYVCFDIYYCDDEDILSCAETVLEKIKDIMENWNENSIFVRNWVTEFDIKRMLNEYIDTFELLTGRKFL